MSFNLYRPLLDELRKYKNSSPTGTFSSADTYEGMIDSGYYRYLHELKNSAKTSYNIPAMGNNSKTDYSSYIGAGASLLGTIGSLYNTYQQSELAEAQFRQQQQNNALTYQMFKEGNAFNAEEAQKAFERSYNASKYSTQAAEMRAAGLNPALMFGEGNLLHPAQSSAASAEGVPSFQSAVGINPPQISFSGIADLAGALKNIAEAKKTGVDTEYLENSLKYRLASDEANSRYAKVLADIKEKYADERERKELAHIDKSIKEMTAQIDLMHKQEGLIDQQTLTELHNTYLKKAEYLRAERLFNAADALDDYWKDFVLGELRKLQNEGKLAGVQADWLPYQAVTGRIGANASMLSASAQDYAARNPNDISGFLVKGLQGAFGNAEEFGRNAKKYVKDLLNVPDAVVDNLIEDIKDDLADQVPLISVHGSIERKVMKYKRRYGSKK